MTSFGRDDDLRGARFEGVDLSGARFSDCELARVVMRGVGVPGAEIDSPWLDEGEPLLVNGVDVTAYVESELCRRFPGRELKRAPDPAALRTAWAAVERAWVGLLERASALPPGTVEVSVAGEWSLSQTLRHLVMATDLWLGKAVLRREQPLHPLGMPYSGAAEDGHDLSVLTDRAPGFDEVLEARDDRVGMVRAYLAEVDANTLAEERPNPHAPEHAETVLSCLHTILAEEWEHLRYATRDLDAIATAPRL